MISQELKSCNIRANQQGFDVSSCIRRIIKIWEKINVVSYYTFDGDIS